MRCVWSPGCQETSHEGVGLCRGHWSALPPEVRKIFWDSYAAGDTAEGSADFGYDEAGRVAELAATAPDDASRSDAGHERMLIGLRNWIGGALADLPEAERQRTLRRINSLSRINSPDTAAPADGLTLVSEDNDHGSQAPGQRNANGEPDGAQDTPGYPETPIGDDGSGQA
jgi:hypothetical protein